jgi:hypothetical protein
VLSGQRNEFPTAVKSLFSTPEPLLSHSSSYSIVLTRLSGPRSRPPTSQKKSGRAGNITRDLWICSQKRSLLGIFFDTEDRGDIFLRNFIVPCNHVVLFCYEGVVSNFGRAGGRKNIKILGARFEVITTANHISGM